MWRGGSAPRRRAHRHISPSNPRFRARSRWRRVRGFLNRDLVVRSTSSSAATVWRSPHGAATACCLSDAVRAPAHVACSFALSLKVHQGRTAEHLAAPCAPLRVIYQLIKTNNGRTMHAPIRQHKRPTAPDAPNECTAGIDHTGTRVARAAAV